MVLLARKDEEGNTQALYDHLHGAGRLASGFEDEFADISRTAAVLHDVGKVAQQFQTYLLSDDGHRGDVQHARQGAFVVNDFFESKGEIEEIAKEILELAISKHHGGLPDCIDESGNRAFLLGFTESDKSNEKYAYQEIKRGLNGLALDLQSNFRGSAEDIACFLKKIKSLGMSKDSIYFYLGLLVKLIYSRLVDADRTDAACFETRKQYRPNTVDWQNLISRLDKSMRSFDSSSEINRIRHQINEQCCLAGARETGIYRLSIPTGGGKTLASLNFALHHALKTGKHRIIYVIPYLSITTQTAKTFRDVLGLNADSDVLLEHYSTAGMQRSADVADNASSEFKHHNIAMRSVRQGGRRDIFLGARECQAYVKPCEFGGGEGFYDSYGEWNMGYMFHGFSYPDENPDHNLISRFWTPIMEDGVIRFESPDSPLLDRHIVRHGFVIIRVDSSPISKEYAIMAALENKIDFAIAFAVNNANPNGDPLNGNRPRTTSEGLGEVSDVALKRKIRNRLQDAGESVFVQSDDRSDDGAKSLSDRFNTYLKTLPKDEQKQKNVVFGKVCERWLDVRSFGQVFAFKKAKDTDEVSIGVRGPVSIQPAFSINPIAIDDVQITKSVNSETTDSGKKSSDTMGMKYRVSGRAVYVTYGSISPQLAERTGFSAEDAEKIKEALVTLFENDESSARPSGSMEVLDVVWFAHNCKGGQYSSAKVHRSVSVDADGTVNVDDASIPGLRYEVIEGR